MKKTSFTHTKGRFNDALLTGLAATIVVNAAMLPSLAAYNGLERLTGDTETLIAQVVDKQFVRGPPGLVLGQVTVETPDGRVIEAFDRFDVTRGKFFPNRHYGHMEVGQTYRIELSISPLGANILYSSPE